MSEFREHLEVAERAARQAGAVLLENLDSDFRISK